MATVDTIPPRREFKYLIDRSVMPALRSAVAPYCDRDPNAGPDGAYALRSLYFDTPDMRLFHANEREAHTRFKARLRWYPESDDAHVFAEIKFRMGDIIRKTRDRLPEDWQSALRAGSTVPLNPFTVRMLRHDLRPVVLVDYRREAFVSRVDQYARVSIDSAIRCQGVHTPTLHGRSDRWRLVDNPLHTWTAHSPLVLELKWAEFAPKWMVELVQRLDLLRHSFSKYCYSMVALAEDHQRDYRDAQSAWI